MVRTYRSETATGVVRKAMQIAEEHGLDAEMKIGGEQFHPDIGEFFRHTRLYVEGDMGELETKRAVSKVADEADLLVDREGPVRFVSDDHAVLRVDWDVVDA